MCFSHMKNELEEVFTANTLLFITIVLRNFNKCILISVVWRNKSDSIYFLKYFYVSHWS